VTAERAELADFARSPLPVLRIAVVYGIGLTTWLAAARPGQGRSELAAPLVLSCDWLLVLTAMNVVHTRRHPGFERLAEGPGCSPVAG
jgi:hypothetical protein